jgi:hypothetical protein
MKAYGGVDVQICVSFISALVGGERSVSRPGRFNPGERAPCTDWIGSWAGPRTCLTTWKEQKTCPYWDTNCDPSAVQHVASHYTDCTIPTAFWVSHAMFKKIRQRIQEFQNVKDRQKYAVRVTFFVCRTSMRLGTFPAYVPYFGKK